MRNILKLAGALALITVIAAGALSKVYLMTRDKIAEVERQRELNAMKTALPAATIFEPDTSDEGYRLLPWVRRSEGKLRRSSGLCGSGAR